ncbi:AbrB/MazE/SpoVT family DNA-binding domain-containing protein [Candidatus Uhrbacteria bacterium]|nr:AbrB/MazE/SpoVT family DNA-binding domain-containing protein [Candidatus Uhrbacteria bacterium]
MIQKLLKVGSSAAVTIPKKSLAQLGLKVGNKVVVEVDTKTRSVLIKAPDATVDQDLVKWTKKFIERYRPALQALAKK